MRTGIMAALVAILGAAPAPAALITVSAYGTVTSLSSSIDGAATDRTPVGLIKLGDAIDYKLVFQTSGMTRSSATQDNPVVSSYNLSPIELQLKIGDYTYEHRLFSPLSYVQLWNNYTSGNTTADGQVFSTYETKYEGRAKSLYPFATGSGGVSEQVSLFEFDRTGTARNSDSIGEIADPAGFRQYFSYTLYDAVSQQLMALRSINMVATITAVPEPSTWALMIGGFGMIGGNMRRIGRRRARLTGRA